jgi:DNA repair protein RadC
MRKTTEGLKIAVQLVRDRSIRKDREVISSAIEVRQLLRYLEREDREHFVVLHLDARNGLIGIETVSIGSLTATIVHPREVLKAALLCNSAGVIVAHNHPSGDSTPSSEDRETTKRLSRAGEIMGIPLLDHLIIAGDSYFSFKEKNWL